MLFTYTVLCLGCGWKDSFFADVESIDPAQTGAVAGLKEMARDCPNCGRLEYQLPAGTLRSARRRRRRGEQIIRARPAPPG